MNDRVDSSKGYTQVSEDYIKGYIDGFTDGRPYFINLGYAIMETTEDNYLSYYKDWSREKYINKLDKQNRLLSFDALDSDEFNGSDIVVDSSENFEDVIDRKLMAQQLPELISKLSTDEQLLIRQLYFLNLSERELSVYYHVSNIAIHKRKMQILKKLKNYFE
jgi:DNA-directed RNA polymerase specialized sigma subunit